MRGSGVAGIAAVAGAGAAVGIRHLLRRRSAAEDATDTDQRWTCACGAEYRMVGTGRHRVIWPADADQSDAVMGGECPSCGRPLAA